MRHGLECDLNACRIWGVSSGEDCEWELGNAKAHVILPKFNILHILLSKVLF